MRAPPSIGKRLGWVTLAYLVLTIVMTWPVALHLGCMLPADLGDPLLNCWIISWGADHWPRILAGDFSAWNDLWNANIYHPAPLTLAYSDHLTAQVLQILPVQALMRNPLLSYNLLFLSTFFLSALGMFLLVDDLTGDHGAAFLSGVLFGFGLYRWQQVSHLQVLSAQWMPFALLGLHRYFTRSSRAWLALAVIALSAQNLSCGYHLFFFMPFAAAFGMLEITMRGLWRDRRRIAPLVIAGLFVSALTLPFLLPYLELRAQGAGARDALEVEAFSADVYSYLTAPDRSWVWGDRLRIHVKPEGELFPGLVPLLMSLLAVVFEARRGIVSSRASALEPTRDGRAPWRRLTVQGLMLVIVMHVIGNALIVCGARGRFYGLASVLPLRSFWVNAVVILGACIAVAALSRRARGAVRSLLESGSLFLAAGIAVAFLLSLGLTMRSHGFAFGPGLFSWLYSHVPGYDGLRVPARFMTEIALFMAALSGIGAARLRSWRPHAARVVVPLAAFLGLAEAATMPLAMNSEIGTDLPRNLPDSLNRGPAPEGIYRDVAALPRDAVIAELPFGDEQCELFYMYASIFHDRRMVNGFSGGAPRRYEDLRETLSNPARNIERAFQALRGAAVTHVIVHEGVWKARIRGRRVTRGLVSRGCRVVGRDGRDVLLAMPRP